MPAPRRLSFSFFVALCFGALLVAGSEGRQRRVEAEAHLDVTPEPPGLKFEYDPGDGQDHHGLFFQDRKLEKAPGVKRVAVLGDSVTHGAFVNTRQTYAGVLEDILGGPSRVEVLNFAFFGYDIQTIATQFPSRVAQWKPDLVVYGYYVNDQLPTRMVTAGATPIWVDPDLRPVSIFGAFLDGQLLKRSAAFRKAYGVAATRWLAENEASQDPDWEFFDRWLATLASAVGELPLVVLAIPPHPLVRADPLVCERAAGPKNFCVVNQGYVEEASRRASALGLTVVDGIAAYRAGPEISLFGPPDDPHHPNAEGHRRLAAALAPVVARELGLPEEEREDGTP